MEVALSLIYEFSLASPLLDVLIKQYKEQPFMAQVVNQVYHILEAAKEKNGYTLGNFMWEFK